LQRRPALRLSLSTRCLDPSSWTLAALQVDAQRLADEFREFLDGRWTASLRKADVAYTTRLVRGDPMVELLRISIKLKATMLVLGAKSHSSVHDLVIGDTVHKIINRSLVPVVLVPAVRSTNDRRPAA